MPGHCDVIPHHGGKDGCRHDVHTGTDNLTQLRRNKRKRADKTSGRKQPRLRDVDVEVEPADDADANVAMLLIAAVAGL